MTLVVSTLVKVRFLGELGGREHETLRGSVRDLDSELEHATLNDWYYL